MIDTKMTSWGKRGQGEIDIRALRRYNKLLGNISNTGEALIAVLLVLIITTTTFLLTQTNFEKAIFIDGTDFVCIYDDDEKGIINVSGT